jgi:hypothetical protein
MHEVAAQLDAIGEIAIVADGESAGIKLGEQRLHVTDDRLAGRRIAHMPNRRRAGQAVNHLAASKGITDETKPAFGMKSLAIEGNDAGCLLAAMLKRVQAERCDGSSVRMTENAEDATLLAQAVGVGIERFIRRGHEVSIVHCHRTLALGCVNSSDRWSGLPSGAS